jgi:hypothetical protein
MSVKKRLALKRVTISRGSDAGLYLDADGNFFIADPGQTVFHAERSMITDSLESFCSAAIALKINCKYLLNILLIYSHDREFCFPIMRNRLRM